MSQRRSKNRRLSTARRSGNLSGFLNENSNIIDGDDALWFNRTSVRPSTSLVLTRNASTFLNSDTTVDDTSQVSEKWYDNLSKSDASKLLEAAAQDNIANQSNKEQEISIFTESESDQEPQKRRTRLRLNRRNINNSEKSNVFLKALEKTTDSHTKNLTHVQTLLGNESESTNDDSKTIQRLRPKIFGNNKQVDNETNKFDDIFNSNSVTERVINNIQFPTVSLNRINENLSTSEVAEKISLPIRKSILKRQSNNSIEELSTLVTAQKQQRRSEKVVTTDVTQSDHCQEKIDDGDVDTNDSSKSIEDKTITNTSKRTSLRLSRSKSNASRQRSINEFINDSHDSAANDVSKKRSTLFSQSQKSKNTSNLFDAIFDSDEESNKNSKSAEQSEKSPEKNLESSENVNENDDNVSDSSSIPRNIRRTRSFSAFGARKRSEEDISVETPDNSKTQKIVEKQKSSRLSKSINEAAENSKRKSTSLNQTNENSSNKELREVIQLDEESSSNSAIYQVPVSQAANEETDDEDIYEKSISSSQKLKSNEHEESQNQSLEQKSSQASKTASTDKSMLKQKNKSNSIRNSQNLSNDTENSENEENLSDSKVIKTRSKLLKSKSQADNENVFDQISYETSKESEKSKNTSKQKSISSLSESKNRMSIQQDIEDENDSLEKESSSGENENDADTSSMPKHIRRTMSRLFQKASSDSANASDLANSSQGKKNKTHDTSIASSTSSRSSNQILREVNRSSSKLFKTPQIPVKNVSVRESNDKSSSGNQKANQVSTKKTNKSQRSITDYAKVSLNKSNLTEASIENEAEQMVNTVRKRAGKSTPINRSINNVEPADLIQRTPERRKSQSRVPVEPRTPDGAASDFNSDDLLTTPHPAQSTLNPYGKPLTRITQFSYRHSIIPESPIAANATVSPPKQASVDKRKKALAPAVSGHVEINNEDQVEDVDVETYSDSNDCPLIFRQIEDIPENEGGLLKTAPAAKTKATNTSRTNGPCASEINDAVWAEIRKKTNALKDRLEARAKRAEQEERERAQQSARIDAKLKRRIAEQEAEKKRLSRKPLDKAYKVNGQPYKQPKLPRPKKWVTPKLYEYLRKCLEPQFGIETRIRSEKFVLKLTDIFNVVVKRKKYDNYKAELDDLMHTMAELNIIETRYDFWRFCSEFMPSSFKEKAVPMQMPGNVRNIPYEPELVYKPILSDAKRRRKLDVSSDSSAE